LQIVDLAFVQRRLAAPLPRKQSSRRCGQSDRGRIRRRDAAGPPPHRRGSGARLPTRGSRSALARRRSRFSLCEAETAPVNNYTADFEIISERLRTRHGWICESCSRNFSPSSDRKFLHVHHKNGMKNNNSDQIFGYCASAAMPVNHYMLT
jgi:hypothetical protein